MPVLDLVERQLDRRPPDPVAAAVREAERWARWWPGLRLRVTCDRGAKGMQWVAQPADLPVRTWLARPCVEAPGARPRGPDRGGSPRRVAGARADGGAVLAVKSVREHADDRGR